MVMSRRVFDIKAGLLVLYERKSTDNLSDSNALAIVSTPSKYDYIPELFYLR